MTETSRFLLHCVLIEGIGPAVVSKLLGAISNENLPQIYDWSVSDCKFKAGLNERVATMLVAGLQNTEPLERELSLISKYNVSWITRIDPLFPEPLGHIHLPPTGLFVRGALPRDPGIAFVGSRTAGAYARRSIEPMIGHLVDTGWSIVSGGALGVDTMAHAATLSSGGQTVVVLGSGLLRPYPQSNRKLFANVIQSGGAVVSAFPLEMEALAAHFPARNRIIAGLSQGCVVVRAAQRSGALITAKFAMQEGREVFAIPGMIDDPLSAGCHAIIQEGAQLIHTVSDICRELAGTCNCWQKTKNKTTTAAQRKNKPAIAKQIPLPFVVSADDPEIVRLCMKPVSTDALVEALGRTLDDIQAELLELQLEGRVEQSVSGLWQRAR